jgi:hypothetical protein
MSEPIASSAEVVAPGLLHWAAYSSEVKTDLSSAAWRSPEGWVLIDPIRLSKEGEEEAFGDADIVAVVLTSGNHDRAAVHYRDRFGIPIHAATEAEAPLGFKVDAPLSEAPIHGLRVIPIPGGGPGETAFLSPEGYLFLGDAVINLESHGLALLPKKYCQSEKENRASLKKLLDAEFSIVSFAHGTPLRHRAKERLRALLE